MPLKPADVSSPGSVNMAAEYAQGSVRTALQPSACRDVDAAYGTLQFIIILEENNWAEKEPGNDK